MWRPLGAPAAGALGARLLLRAPGALPERQRTAGVRYRATSTAVPLAAAAAPAARATPRGPCTRARLRGDGAARGERAGTSW